MRLQLLGVVLNAATTPGSRTIRVSSGVGVRLTLPIFGQVPLALDFGFPVLKGRQDETQIVSFSLGFTQ